MRQLRIGIFVLVVIIALYQNFVSTANRSTRSTPAAATPRTAPAQVIAEPEKKSTGTPLPAGDLYATSVNFQFAIYYLPQPAGDPRAQLQTLIETQYKQFHESTSKDAEQNVAFPLYHINPIKITDYLPPDGDHLEHGARGLSGDQKKALAGSKSVLVLDFFSDRAHGLAALKDAQRLLHDLAESTHGLIWDEETREIFAPAEWQKKRAAPWTGELPSIPDQVVIHFYADGELNRMVTLGMSKFGLPDVVVEDVPRIGSKSMGGLVNLACQTMAERGKIDVTGVLSVDVNALRNADYRQRLIKTYKKNATGKAALNVTSVVSKEGDAKNRLVEICFPVKPAETLGPQQRKEALISSLFGSEDAIKYVKHSPELLAASARAKAKIAELAPLFRKGMPPGESIQVKAPFATPAGGDEWMWVEVSKWAVDGTIEGILDNDPFDIPTLKAGAKVRVKQDSLFDYIHVLPGGKFEGNETSPIIEREEEVGR